MIICPTCNALLDRSARLIEGVTVLRCRNCRQFRIEGDDKVIEASADPIKDLRLRAYQLNLIKIDEEVMSSDINDPRWERIS